jgi:hypothetical protein
MRIALRIFRGYQLIEFNTLIDAHKFLANVYSELGQQEQARRERSAAERLRNP